jgi:predicted dehydrogenase
MNNVKPPSATRLKVAFLGGALNSAVGRAHRAAIAMDQRYDLVAGCFSRHADINAESAASYGVETDRLYGGLDQLLAAEAGRLDAIIILTPTNQHRDQVLACLAADVPVICEKALVGSSTDAKAIQGAVADHDGFLAVTYNYTGYPMLRELRDMIAHGQLGEIEQILVEMPQEGFAKVGPDNRPITPQDWRLHDGSVPVLSLDLGVHLHSLAYFLTGQHPLDVVAMSNTFGNFNEIVDTVSCMARYSADISCSMWYSKTALGYRNGLKVRVFGKKGAAEWVQELPETLLLADDHGRKTIFDRASPEARIANLARYTRFKAGHPAGFIEAFANYYVDVADALAARAVDRAAALPPYVLGIEVALDGIAMLEAIARSNASRAWERVG